MIALQLQNCVRVLGVSTLAEHPWVVASATARPANKCLMTPEHASVCSRFLLSLLY